MLKTDFIGVMQSFVGIREIPDGTNKTPLGIEYGWNGVPWCAITVSVACNRLGFPLHEAAVINIERRAQRGDYGMRWSLSPVDGAAVCFDFGPYHGKPRGNPAYMHTGVVIKVVGESHFVTIEGNYANRVDVWPRDMKYVRGFATFPFDDPTEPAPPIPTPEEVMHATYVRRDTSGHVCLLFDSGIALHVTDYSNTEEVFVNTLGVELRQYGTTQPAPDAQGDVRNVWVVDEGTADMLGLPR